MKISIFKNLLFVSVILNLSACGELSKPEILKIDLDVLNEVLDERALDVEIVSEFNKVFKVRHHMLLSGRYPGEAIWSAKALICERYVFVMRVPVKASKDGGLIQESEDVDMYICEIEKVDGRSIIYSGNQRRISLTEWKKLLDSGMDFSIINYPIKTDKPVRGLREVFPVA